MKPHELAKMIKTVNRVNFDIYQFSSFQQIVRLIAVRLLQQVTAMALAKLPCTTTLAKIPYTVGLYFALN
jgi:hypothetical protein